MFLLDMGGTNRRDGPRNSWRQHVLDDWKQMGLNNWRMMMIQDRKKWKGVIQAMGLQA